jgi:peptidoglycan/xylan/chitin deacetylase (PgdA/CDA1 family)/GT2 family glycosyltransferase
MKASIIVTARRGGAALDRTVAAALAQDVRDDFEVLAVAGAKAAEVRRSDARLLVIAARGSGRAAARNAALEASRGEYVLWLEAGDVVGPDLLSRHLAAHAAAEGGVVRGPVLPLESSEPASAPPRGAGGGLSNASARRAAFVGGGGFDEKAPAGEDAELELRLRKAGVAFRGAPDAVARATAPESLEDERGDARLRGRADVYLSRKHPEHRARCGLARLAAGGALRRGLRRCAASAPLACGPALDLPRRLCGGPRGPAFARRLGARLSALGRRAAYLRGAREEAGSWAALREEFARTLHALVYHHVGPARSAADASLTVSTEDFARQIRGLARRGYVGIAPSAWLAWRREGRPLPPKPILVTFDDGYADTAANALPVLKRFGFSAGLFIVTGELGGTNSWDAGKGMPVHRLLTAEQIRAWAAQGFEFGAHTRRHRDLTRLDAAELRDEISGSAADLAGILGAPPLSFAYSFGRYDEAARASAAETFALAFTIEGGLNTLETDPFLMKRAGVKPGRPGADFWIRARLGRNPLSGFAALLRRLTGTPS